MVVTVLVAIEVCQVYVIRGRLTEAARQAARDLSAVYRTHKEVAGDRQLQNSMVFDHIRLPGVVTDSQQFDDAGFCLVGHPGFVRVSVNFDPARDHIPIITALPGGNPLHLVETATYCVPLD